MSSSSGNFISSLYCRRQSQIVTYTNIFGKFSLSRNPNMILYAGGPRYMRSFYLRFIVYAIENWPIQGIYPLINRYPWSF